MSGSGFTGRHMAFVMVGGFGVVIAANLVMAVLATRSHPGMVVESSYVAGQKFNGWLEAGRAQKQQGWAVTARTDGKALEVRALNALGRPLADARVEVRLRHPLGAEEAAVLVLDDSGEGRHRALLPVSPGLWDVEIAVRRGSDRHWMRTRITVAG